MAESRGERMTRPGNNFGSGEIGLREIVPLALEEQIEAATLAIRRALAGLAQGARPALENVLAAFDEVRRVTEMRGARSRGNAPIGGPPCGHILAEYRAALREWDRELPRLHGWLLAERARIESRRLHAGSVQTWLDANRKTM